ncbi:MAG: hypothetical protein IPI02_05360 [Sterolibacteriaceae bacterium]|nr:hypothetical protein [Sterolibacteriaceae bacterium]
MPELRRIYSEARNARHQRVLPLGTVQGGEQAGESGEMVGQGGELGLPPWTTSGGSGTKPGGQRTPVTVGARQRWRRQKSQGKEALPRAATESAQEDLPAAESLAQQISCNAPIAPLQDLLNAQPIVLVGLIAHIWGTALQEDIASAVSRLVQLGLDIRGGHHEHCQAGSEPGTPASGARTLQLGRSPPGAEHTIEKADVCAWALYLFLVAVADVHGLSYYAEASLSRRLGLDPHRLAKARSDLIGLDLIAYDPPLYQVLSLPVQLPMAARLEQLHAILGRR